MPEYNIEISYMIPVAINETVEASSLEEALEKLTFIAENGHQDILED